MRRSLKLVRKIKYIKKKRFLFFYPLNFYRTINKIKQGILRKKIFIDIPYDKKTYNLLIFFLREGFLMNFYLFLTSENLLFIRLSLKYLNNKSLIKDFIFISNKKKVIFHTYKQLINLYYKNPLTFIFIQTSLGLFPLQKVLKYKIGGILLFQIK
jgi:ribosomal protein S8